MLQALLLSHLAASGFATVSRSPAELSAFELADVEHRPLLLPEQRQLAGSLQPLGVRAIGWVPSRIASTRSGARKASCSARDMHARTTGDGAEAQSLVGIEIVGDMRACLDQPAH